MTHCQCLVQVRIARQLLGNPTSTTGQVLLAAAWRQEGVLLMDSMAKYDNGVEAFRQARNVLEFTQNPALTMRMQQIVVLAQLAGALDYIGAYDEGNKVGAHAVSCAESFLGPEHPILALSLTNHAFFLRGIGDPNAACEAHRRAGSIRAKVLGEQHPDVGISFNQEALCLQDLKRFPEAEASYLKALDIRMKRLGEDHFMVANTYNNLGSMHALQGKTAQAIAAYQHCHRIRLSCYGPGHKKVVDVEKELEALGHKIK